MPTPAQTTHPDPRTPMFVCLLLALSFIIAAIVPMLIGYGGVDSRNLGNFTVALEQDQILIVSAVEESVEITVSSRQENEHGEPFALYLINQLQYEEAELTVSLSDLERFEVQALVSGPIVVTLKSSSGYETQVKPKDAVAHTAIAMTLLATGLLVMAGAMYIAARLPTSRR